MPFSEKNALKSPSTPFLGGFSNDEFELFKKKSRLDLNYYMEGEEIIRYSKLRISFSAMIGDGKVSLKSFDEAGNLLEEEILKKGDVVGELFGMPPVGVSYVLTAKTDCNLYFFDARELFTSWGGKISGRQFEFLSFLLNKVSLRLQKREERLLILKRPTTGEKLLAYLKAEAKKANSAHFKLKMSQTELSEYLLTNRSALSREISRLNKEGIIKSKGKSFSLLQKSP